MGSSTVLHGPERIDVAFHCDLSAVELRVEIWTLFVQWVHGQAQLCCDIGCDEVGICGGIEGEYGYSPRL